MLGTVLDKITTLVGRAFVISAFFPILLFAAANLATLAAIEGVGGINRRWKALEGIQTLGSITFFVVAIAAAYVLMLISPVLKRLLEDAEALPTLRELLLRRNRQQFWHQRAVVHGALNALIQSKDRRNTWTKALIEARPRTESPHAAAARSSGATVTDAEAQLGGVQTRLANGASLELKELEEASKNVQTLYQAGDRFAETDRYHKTVMELWADLEKATESTYSQALADIQSRYAYGEGVAGVQSTALGNILASAWSYPFTRYGIDASLMWPRLQKVIPADYFRVVEDARTSYDFSVNLTFLALSYSVVWLCSGNWLWPVRPLWPVAVFLAIGLLTTWLFHRAAVEAARAFGAVFRTCFDLFRFKLLEEMRIPLPSDIASERELWTRISDILIFDDHSLDLKYLQPAASTLPAPLPSLPQGGAATRTWEHYTKVAALSGISVTAALLICKGGKLFYHLWAERWAARGKKKP